MPYRIEKRDSKYAIVNKQTGKTVGKSDTRKQAAASVRARMRYERKK